MTRQHVSKLYWEEKNILTAMKFWLRLAGFLSFAAIFVIITRYLFKRPVQVQSHRQSDSKSQYYPFDSAVNSFIDFPDEELSSLPTYLGHDSFHGWKAPSPTMQTSIKSSNPSPLYVSLLKNNTIRILQKDDIIHVPPLDSIIPPSIIFDHNLVSLDNFNPPASISSTLSSAALVIVCSNDDIDSVRRTIRTVEDRFNREKGYPWVLLNSDYNLNFERNLKPSQPSFSAEFKQLISKTLTFSKSKVSYGSIHDSKDDTSWSTFQAWVNTSMHQDSMKSTQYISYIIDISRENNPNTDFNKQFKTRHLARWMAGPFLSRHPLVSSKDWYWRIDPGSELFCDFQKRHSNHSHEGDPFKLLASSDKKHGFVIISRGQSSVTKFSSLWSTANEYLISINNAVNRESSSSLQIQNHFFDFFIDSTKEGSQYSGCKFSPDFEITSNSIWQSSAFEQFFQHLDQKGGFFLEDWEAAEVRTLFLSVALKKSQVHFFHGM